MKKTIICKTCGGTGKDTVDICDKCKKEARVGEYEGEMICPDCWAGSLSEEEIMNL